ncbi:MAG: hypothetical protein KME20_25305 [Kaiparowitsia implicata GSE-PSE-MK54-09C]|nr:hypothetical protein [Kaiparowitsia implicata GSE-PSE-MK54-09C]
MAPCRIAVDPVFLTPSHRISVAGRSPTHCPKPCCYQSFMRMAADGDRHGRATCLNDANENVV